MCRRILRSFFKLLDPTLAFEEDILISFCLVYLFAAANLQMARNVQITARQSKRKLLVTHEWEHKIFSAVEWCSRATSCKCSMSMNRLFYQGNKFCLHYLAFLFVIAAIPAITAASLDLEKKFDVTRPALKVFFVISLSSFLVMVPV